MLPLGVFATRSVGIYLLPDVLGHMGLHIYPSFDGMQNCGTYCPGCIYCKTGLHLYVLWPPVVIIADATLAQLLSSANAL